MTVALPDSIRPIRFEDGALQLLDQRRLPDEERWNAYHDAAGVADAIRDMVVRGAPAIGITAAFGVALAARSPDADGASLDAAIERLRAARPTAVNLFWALDRCAACVTRHREAGGGSPASLAQALTELAQAMLEQDVADNRRMGAFGAALIPPGGAVLTHCNTGSLATGGFGTALGVIRAAWADGRIERVYADETRPWLQGARLTAWELVRDGIPVDLLCEGAAASLLRSGTINAVVVGADRIAANGDTANKIGTYMLALAARAHGVPFLVAAPTATIDPATADGVAIPIEQRAADEILSLAGHRVAAPGAGAWNPAFDVTPAALIDAIVTERGVVRAPDRDAIARLLHATDRHERRL